MSSCFSRSKVSGPLVTGQTSISSSLGSMDRLVDEGDERGVDDHAQRQVPEALIGECCAFYRVLLRHQDRERAGERYVVGDVDMVVGKGVLGGRDAKRGDHVEKAPR